MDDDEKGKDFAEGLIDDIEGMENFHFDRIREYMQTISRRDCETIRKNLKNILLLVK